MLGLSGDNLSFKFGIAMLGILVILSNVFVTLLKNCARNKRKVEDRKHPFYITRLGRMRANDGTKIIRIVVIIMARRKGNMPLKIFSKGTSVAMPFIT